MYFHFKHLLNLSFKRILFLEIGIFTMTEEKKTIEKKYKGCQTSERKK